MAGPCARCKLFPAGKYELAQETAIDGSNTLVVSCIPTFAPTQISALAQNFALAPGLLGRYIEKDLWRATKLALESFVWNQKYHQNQANFMPYNWSLKTKNPNFYYDHLHLKYYYFY